MKSTNQDIIYQGNSIISIETLSDYLLPVVVKKPAKKHPSPRDIQSLEKEYEMTRALDNVKGVRQAFEKKSVNNQPFLILENIDGETLYDYNAGKRLSLNSKLKIAIDLARILSEIHQQNLIHLDLNSKNILIANEPQAVRLIDLGCAAHIDRSGQQKVQLDQTLGTLPYISPEQTGRINRAVDERSDLYSLGIVLYELMTGQLPFESKNPMEIIHYHITKMPASPSELSSKIPMVTSSIILKLLKKDAEERYQSAAGVQADLEKCLQRLSPEDTIEEFPLGEADYTGRLKFPQKLYGRDRELKELENVFKSISRDTASIVFIGGYSGIGKTALIEELQRPVSEKNGYFIEGKFDQLVTTPYAGISQGLDLFISQILTQSEIRLSALRSKILEALGPNGGVLTNIVPSLELVIGPQPAVPELSGQEAQNRFNYVFQRFFGAIVNSEHPICFFLDDLQWIDSGSLDLLKALFTSPDLAHLLVIGAYRDNEVDEDHPLKMFIADLEKAGAYLKRMTLPKLAEADVEALISDTLRCDPVETRELARLIYSQTDGNPFFIRQVLRNLEDQDLLVLDTTAGNWRCDMDALKDLDLTASVVELLEGKLKELPVAVQETLKIAACIGNRFDFAILNVVATADEKTMLDHVHEAVSAGLIWERDNRVFFVHDRVQEAAYALLPPEDRDHTHLMIGRLLLKRYYASDHEQVLYKIVDQLNHGLHLLEDKQERIQLAQLNLKVGRNAKQSSAFSSSAEYLKQSASLLDEKMWQERYPLVLEIYNEWIQACFLAQQYQEVEVLFHEILEQGKQAADLRVAFKTMILMNIGKNDLFNAISIAEQYLEMLQISFDPALESKLSIDDLYVLPVMKDNEKQAAMEILVTIINPMGVVGSERFNSLIYTLMNIISEYGNCEVSSIVVTWYGTLLSAQGKYQEGYDYGQLGVKLLDKFPSDNMASGILNMQSAWIQPWVSPVHDLIAPLKESGHIGIKQGAFENASDNLANRLILMWCAGSSLSVYLTEAEECIRLCQRTRQEMKNLITSLFTQAAQNLSEKSAQTTKLEGKWFSEERLLPNLEGNVFVLRLYQVLKMTLAYLFGDSLEAYGHIDELLRSRTPSLYSHYFVFSKISFYGALSCIARLSNADNDVVSREILEKLEIFEEELRLWAQSAPMNFQHQYDLVMAEKSMLNKENWKAIQLYEAAIKGAKENRFVHEEALANELYARFWQKCGNERIAEIYVHNAHSLYQQWGANAKVGHIEKCYPQWFQTETILTGKSHAPDGADKVHTTITQPVTSIQLDMESIISTSQMLSAEIDFEQLLTKMITLVMAYSGAENAELLEMRDNDWFVQARGNVTIEKYDILLNQTFDPFDCETCLIPESVFNYCRRSKEVLVVGNAKLDQRFGQDRTIQTHQVISLACFPVLRQGKLKAMLYLENRQLADVFTLENIGILKHLSSQFGVSVENALLYDNLAQKIKELRESEERYQLAVAGSAAGLWDWDIHLDKVHYSDRFIELLGYTPDEFLNSDDEFWNRLHPDDYEAARLAVDQHLKERVPYIIDFRLQTKSGEYRWFHARGQALWDNTGIATRMSGSLTDITERKLADEELKISKERYELVVSGSDAGIWDYNISTGEIYYSDRFKELLGYEHHEMNDHTPEMSWDFLHPDHREIAPLKLNQHLEKQTPYYLIDYLVKKKSGEYRWFQARGKAVWDENGQATKIAGSLIDIHERKMVEEALKRSERHFRHLMESSPLSIAIFNPDGNISQVNSAWKKLWGISEEETAQVMASFNFISDKQIENLGIAPLVERAFKGESIILPPITYDGNTTMYELGLEDIEAKSRTIQVHLHSVKDAKGEIEYVVAINMDLTKLKQAEQETLVQREALARMDRATRMGQLTGSIAHELNQPLTGILSNAQAVELMLKSNKWKHEEYKQIIAEIVADTKRAGDVIRNLRELYREHKGEHTPVDINSVAEDAIKLMNSEFIMKQVEIISELVPSIPFINGNKFQLQQVLVNLIMNAEQAMSSIVPGKRKLHIVSAFDDKEVKVCVDDFGPGIEVDKIVHIFEPLATWKPGGTGMGLAIGNSIIDAHGGRMWAENRSEGGARVGFAIPVMKKDKKT